MCDYDGGDCCASVVSYEMCSLGNDCRCHFTGKMHRSFKTGCIIHGDLIDQNFIQTTIDTPRGQGALVYVETLTESYRVNPQKDFLILWGDFSFLLKIQNRTNKKNWEVKHATSHFCYDFVR